MSAADVLQIPELADEIVAHMGGHQASLSSTALASSCLLVAAQKQLFAKVTLSSDTAATRLHKVLQQSPHLAVHTRTLSLQFSSLSSASPIPGLELLNVRELIIADCWSLSQFKRMASALPLGSVQDVTIISDAHGCCDLVRHLGRTLVRPLSRLSILSVPTANRDRYPSMAAALGHDQVDKLPVNRLIVDNLIVDGLLDDIHTTLRSLIDFKQLQTFAYQSTQMVPLPPLLSICSETLTALTVLIPRAQTSIPDICASLPGLRTLTFAGITKLALPSLAHALKPQSPLRGGGLCIVISVDELVPRTGKRMRDAAFDLWDWAPVDVVLAAKEHIGMVHITMNGAAFDAEAAKLLRRRFTLLDAQRKLSIG
ncbi:hypothetical protein MKEN_00470300 [Mycena kentingensis (nom. inval.)]|nr:hypothetical protein MKEN_00470300 [Mycena kentingensis (nom. inval.)]